MNNRRLIQIVPAEVAEEFTTTVMTMDECLSFAGVETITTSSEGSDKSGGRQEGPTMVMLMVDLQKCAHQRASELIDRINELRRQLTS